MKLLEIEMGRHRHWIEVDKKNEKQIVFVGISGKQQKHLLLEIEFLRGLFIAELRFYWRYY